MKKNIILIGMPSCGKTTIAKKIHEIDSVPFADSDEEIVKKMKCTIPEIFQNYGEPAFRKIENEIIHVLSKKSGHIISTGGGVVLNPDNIEALKENGIIIFIDRDLEKLKSNDPERPLSKDPKALQELYSCRISLYQKYADKIIKNNGKIEEVVQSIREVYL